MKKKKSNYAKDEYSRDAMENDKYLLKLREVAKNHPEIIPEYKNFCTYQAGFTNGVLHQIENYILMAEEMKDLKEQNKEKEFYRCFFNGADGISYNKTTFFNFTEVQFINWVDQMAKDGYIPQGEWQDFQNQWGGLTYKFNKSFVDELKPKEKKK